MMVEAWQVCKCYGRTIFMQGLLPKVTVAGAPGNADYRDSGHVLPLFAASFSRTELARVTMRKNLKDMLLLHTQPLKLDDSMKVADCRPGRCYQAQHSASAFPPSKTTLS